MSKLNWVYLESTHNKIYKNYLSKCLQVDFFFGEMGWQPNEILILSLQIFL